jgi:hypothetical protein
MSNKTTMIFILSLLLFISCTNASDVLGDWGLTRATRETFVIVNNPDQNNYALINYYSELETASSVCSAGTEYSLLRFKNINQIDTTSWGASVSSLQGKIPYFFIGDIIVNKNTAACHFSRTDCGFDIAALTTCNWNEQTANYQNTLNSMTCIIRSDAYSNLTNMNTGTHNFTCSNASKGTEFTSSPIGAGLTPVKDNLWYSVLNGIYLNQFDLAIENSIGHKNVGYLYPGSKNNQNGTTTVLVGWYYEDNSTYFYNNQSVLSIDKVDLSSQGHSQFGAYDLVTVTVTSHSNKTENFRVGLSVGRADIGFCDQQCYVNRTFSEIDPPYEKDQYNNTWFTIDSLEAGQTKTYQGWIRYLNLPGNTTYDILATVRPTTNYNLINNYYITEGLYLDPIPVKTTIVFNANINRVSPFVNVDSIFFRANFTNDPVGQPTPLLPCHKESNNLFTCGLTGYWNYPQVINVSIFGSQILNYSAQVNQTVAYQTYLANLNYDNSYKFCAQIGDYKKSDNSVCEVTGNKLVSDPKNQLTSWTCKFINSNYFILDNCTYLDNPISPERPTKICTFNATENVGAYNTDSEWWGFYRLFVCSGGYLNDGLIANASTAPPGNQQILPTNETPTSPLTIPLATVFNISEDEAKAFISLIVTIFAVGLVVIKTSSEKLGMTVFISMLIMFTLIHWFPAWILIILIVIVGIIWTKILTSGLGG